METGRVAGLRPKAGLTPCSSSFSSCSVTLGVLRASRKQWMLSSGMTYSSASFRGRPRPVPCLVAVGVASSRMEPRSVMSCSKEREKAWSGLSQALRGLQHMKGPVFTNRCGSARWCTSVILGTMKVKVG